MTAMHDQATVINKATELAKAGQFKAALATLDSLNALVVENVEAAYVRAVCLRRLGQPQKAVSQLQSIVLQDPSFARAHQEVGHIFRQQGNARAAIEAFERAVSVDSALIGSWRALKALHEENANPEGALQARLEIKQLEALHPALQAVKSFLNRDDIDSADQACRQYMQQNKQDIEGMRLLAEIAQRAKILDDAEFILESAVTFAPDHVGARFDYANVLIKRQKFGAAHEIALALINEQPDVLQFQGLYASALAGVGETQSAVDLYRTLIAQGYNLHHAYLLCGHAEKTLGNLPAAIECYQRLYELQPDYGDAFWSLANTKAYEFSDDEVTHMLDYKEREETSAIDKVHFNFALGKAYEDRKEYDLAFRAYGEGNRLNKEILNYQSPEVTKRVQYQKNNCTKALFERLSDVGHSAPDPIFILGLPRAGSTLLEQILASHSQVDGTLELPNILSLSRRLRGRDSLEEGAEPQYPKILATLETDYFAKFGEQYIEETHVFRQGAAFFIDKMPNNFMHVGLIKLILPNAKVIDARRHPMACCFSGFKQLFAEGQEFTYGLQEIGDYYKNYVELMDHWDAVLPGFVLRVQHEDVVNDLEFQVRKILDFCGLPFEESCLEFYKTERNVRTPSSEQVRQPIYKTGLEQWRNFERHLKPLIDALGDDVLARYPFEAA